MGTPEPRGPRGLDLDRLREYLDTLLPGLVTGELRAEVISGGRSNLTYTVTDECHRWVLRRPPLGHVLATAHDMAREYRVISALGPSPVPVPQAVHLCVDPGVVGVPFYLMEHVPGAVYRDPDALAALGPAGVRSLAFALLDTLADLHAVDPAAVGLADFGRPAGFNERQVRRWKRQLDASRSREVPGIDELHDRLAADVPPVVGAGAIVHGDFRLDNVVVDEADGSVRAVLDWEMSTLGDPLGDLALTLVYTGLEFDTGGGSARALATVPGFPRADELIARYAGRAGGAATPIDPAGLRWYRAFAAFKLAVILEGVHFRYSTGQTVGEGFEHLGGRVAPLVATGHAALEER